MKIMWLTGDFYGIISTYAMQLNTGNFILTDSGLEVLWQSFDHPTYTLLPRMTLGRNDWSLKSWKSVLYSDSNFENRVG